MIGAYVWGSARVSGHARVMDGARVRDNAEVSGTAVVRGGAVIAGQGKVDCGRWVNITVTTDRTGRCGRNARGGNDGSGGGGPNLGDVFSNPLDPGNTESGSLLSGYPDLCWTICSTHGRATAQ